LKTLYFACRYMCSRPLGAALNVLLLSLGLASITLVLLVSAQLAKAFERDLTGIDVVVGAKGSPLQLILSGVLQIDVPPGNVPLQAIHAIANNPSVDRLIPISLGDSYQGFRIVGTTYAYLDHYQATLAQGNVWAAPMQVVLGATAARKLRLTLGQSFVGSHGLGAGGHTHGDSPYTVVGILAPTGSVLDRLIVTDTASVWQVHEDATALDDEDRKVMEAEREITLALVKYTTPMAALSFPRYVNTSTEMQAASPALEISRLFNTLGLGADVLRAFASLLLLCAGLSVFIAFWNAVRERRHDLALLRLMGAPPHKVASLLLCEAALLGLAASALGLLLGQGFAWALAWFLQLDDSLLIGGTAWPADLWVVPCLAFSVALVSALLPTVAAYRVSVLSLLQNRSF
jgi:putative ABC transport system permease protein